MFSANKSLFVPALIVAAGVSVSAAFGETITVFGPLDNPPYTFSGEKGEPAGFEVELLQGVARDRGMELEFVEADWTNDLEGDVSTAKALTASNRNEQFTLPVDVRYHVVFAPNDSIIRGLEDLKVDRKVAVVEGDPVRSYLGQLGINRIAVHRSGEEALQSVIDGETDAAVLEQQKGLLLAEQIGGVRMTGETFFGREFAFATTDSSLRDSLNAGLRVMDRTGQQATLAKAWIKDTPRAGDNGRTVMAYLQWVVTPLVLLIVAAGVHASGLRRKQARRIVELERDLAKGRRELGELREETARQRYVMNQLSTVTLVDQLVEVSGSSKN
ncbi:MAG: transporter substrate-binding domain-containing protein [Verrucomicrobiota bacterium]